MSLSKKDEEILKRLLDDALRAAMDAGKNSHRDKFKLTEKRLYAYPILKRNIVRYQLDIEDVQKEDFRKSKDFILFLRNAGTSEKNDLEEIRAERIFNLQQKLVRDEREVKEIETALEEIKKEAYFQIIPMKYFESCPYEGIAEKLKCDVRTVGRNKKRLVEKLILNLYGAEGI